MSDILNRNINFNRPVKLADDVYWVGFFDPDSGLQCNPYLIIDGDEGVLLDGGSRPDFATVMMKILQTGLEPGRISTMIYHHYDPDLCGSIPNLEDIINRPDLKIVSHSSNNVFIRYYATKSKMYCIDSMDRRLKLASGRVLRFIPTPYSHSAGSFMTLDEKTGILFTSDIFGAYESKKTGGELFATVNDECVRCVNPQQYGAEFDCVKIAGNCPIASISRFHRKIMTSNAALRYAVNKIIEAKPSKVAPQHGAIVHNPADIEMIARKILSLNDIGFDGVKP